MPEIAISIKNLSKIYKLYDNHIDRLKEALHPFKKKYHQPFYALKNISLEVREGEILGVIGRNGAGKSSLLKIISGVLTPTTGTVQVNGKVSALLELGTGFNPQLNGIENIYINGTLNGFSKKEMNQRIDSIVSFADIGDFIKQPIKSYSSGMKSRLGFALAIHMNPEILILDEVLAVGDEMFRRKCYAKITDILKSGCTVLFVSHSMGAVNEICSRAIFLDNGQELLEGYPKMVTMHYQKYAYMSAKEKLENKEYLLALNQDPLRKSKFQVTESSPSPDEDTLTPVPLELPLPNLEEENGSDDTAENSSEPEPVTQVPFLIPNFKPQSTVKIKNGAIDILDSRLQTIDGKDVNALVMNEEYIYSYKVQFDCDIDNVQFGMGIKTEKGQPLTWSFYPGTKKFSEEMFKAGDSFWIKSRFKCLVLPGNYFTELAIRRLTEDNVVMLLKIVDEKVFKVLDESELRVGGLFDSQQLIQLEQCPQDEDDAEQTE
jgi:lipopolysaccharide transport system ATP-binding protein